jgi:hypothetical protein
MILVFGTQFGFQNLAGGGMRQFIHKYDIVGQLPFGKRCF